MIANTKYAVDHVFSLKGDLGSGKTTLVQQIGKAFGVSDHITSPTFSIVHSYESQYPLYHLDLYRLDSPGELEAIDYETYFYPDDGVTFIEWAERGIGYVPDNMIEIELKHREGNCRSVAIGGGSIRSKALIQELNNENFSD